MDIVRHPGEDLFFEAILSLRTVEDCRLFFEDVATIKELQAMSQRFRVACLLDSGENYIEVSESTGASSATISRVNRCLVYGGGYRSGLFPVFPLRLRFAQPPLPERDKGAVQSRPYAQKPRRFRIHPCPFFPIDNHCRPCYNLTDKFSGSSRPSCRFWQDFF